MGTQIKNSTLVFFDSQMDGHSCVETYTRLPVEDEIVFEIQRKNGLPPINVHASDAYRYDFADFASRPKEIRRGDFILIARPEATFDPALVAIAREECMGIGMFIKFKGALNYRNVWEYRSREERGLK